MKSSFSRRQFLIYLGIGSYGLLRGTDAWSSPIAAARFPTRKNSSKPKLFTPIAPSIEDALRLPRGFRADRVISYGDALGSTGPRGAEYFGSDNDFLAYFPIDVLTGGTNSRDGLLWANHENFHPLFVSGLKPEQPRTKEQIEKEKSMVGGSVLRVTKKGQHWSYLQDAATNHRYTASYPEIAMTGPAAATVPTTVGTLANCSGGVTPWHTVLTCEENYQSFTSTSEFGWGRFKQTALVEEQYGWIVEIDPFRKMPPKKHSSLGRFAHENAAVKTGKSGRLVIYMGDDSRDQFFYKFVSNEKHNPSDARADQRKVLEAGVLYAADFVTNRWLPLDLQLNSKLREAGFKSQAQVLVETRRAASIAGATPMDRPEDCEIHPLDGSVYIAFTNNSNHGNAYGQIVRLVENGDDAESLEFQYEIFLTGGPQAGLAAPDNLCFDKDANLWVCCDVSSTDIHKGAYKNFGNNGMFFIPTRGKDAGTAYQFASAPVDAELTGPWFTAGFDTLFLSVQHPGETTTDLSKPTSHWPDGGTAMPRSSVMAITGFKS